MDQQWSTWVQPVLTALLTIVLVLLIFKVRKSKYHTPPGPRGWPVLGSIPLLGPNPHQSLAKLAKKYGPLMSMKLGSVNFIIVSSPKVAEEFLKIHDRIWASRPTSAANRIMGYDGKDIAYGPYGPRWRYAKKVFVLELLTPKRLSEFQKTRKQEIMIGINDAIDQCCSGTKAVRMDLAIRNFALNIMLCMLTNKNSLSGTEHDSLKDIVTDEFQETIKDAFVLFGAFYVGDFIPWLDRFDPQGMKKRMHATYKKYDDFLQRVLDDHKMKLEARKTQPTTDGTAQVLDIVDTLLTRPSDVDGHHFTDDELKAIMQDVIIGGTDTNASTTEWGLSELLKKPHILEKAQAEMDSVVGRDRLVEESDLPNLPYLCAIVKETFRLHPVAPLLLPHVSVADCEIQGYKIPAKSRLFVNVYAIQRDPEVYDRATEFYPERFLSTPKDVHGQDFDLLPFGSGRRICPAKGLGLMLVQYAMALMIQTCNISLPADMKPEELDVEELFGLTVPKLNPLQAILSPRLPKHVLHDF